MTVKSQKIEQTEIGFCGKCGILRQDTDGVPDVECACLARTSGHTENCRYLVAVRCPISFPCEEHGDDICRECYACNCGVGYVTYFKKDDKVFSQPT